MSMVHPTRLQYMYVHTHTRLPMQKCQLAADRESTEQHAAALLLVPGGVGEESNRSLSYSSSYCFFTHQHLQLLLYPPLFLLSPLSSISCNGTVFTCIMHAMFIHVIILYILATLKFLIT